MFNYGKSLRFWVPDKVWTHAANLEMAGFGTGLVKKDCWPSVVSEMVHRFWNEASFLKRNFHCSSVVIINLSLNRIDRGMYIFGHGVEH